MLERYEKKAEDILEKLAKEEPNERNFEMMANALTIMAGGKIMGAMDGMSRYDGGRDDEYYRGRRRDSMGRFRYDGADGRMDGRRDYYDDGMERDKRYWDDGREMEHDGRRMGRKTY